jgi:hypothetical protein
MNLEVGQRVKYWDADNILRFGFFCSGNEKKVVLALFPTGHKLSDNFSPPNMTWEVQRERIYEG